MQRKLNEQQVKMLHEMQDAVSDCFERIVDVVEERQAEGKMAAVLICETLSHAANSARRSFFETYHEWPEEN